MFQFVATLAALAVSAQPATSSLETQLERFNRAIVSGNGLEAAPIVDGLIASRLPADGAPASDALVNSMIGRLYLLAGHEAPALGYLAQAPANSLPPSVRAETLLAYAIALKRHGRREEALAAFRGASRNATDLSQDFRSAIGLAEELLPTDPGGALRLSFPLLTSAEAASRWRAAYVSSLASSLLGDQSTARMYADRAWTDAAMAPPRELAPLHVSVLRAGLAAQAGDKQALHAMLAAANAMAVSRGDDVSRQLPVCGDDGLKPSDFVIFGALTGPYHSNSLVPIAASNPSIVAAFHDRLAGRAVLKADNVSYATGTVFTVSCVTRVDSGFMKDTEPSDPLVGWFAQRGIYPVSMKPESDDPGINEVGNRLDDLQRRFGKHSPLLIQAQWQLLMLLEVRSLAGDPVPPGRLVELRAEIIDGLKRSNAPGELVDLLELRTEMDRLMRAAAAQGKPDLAAFQSIWTQVMQKVPFPVARRFVRSMLESFRENFPTDQIKTVMALGDRAPSSLSGRDKQAFLLTLAGAKRSAGMLEEARRDVAATGLAPDICVRADSPPIMLEQKFRPDDYPYDLVPAELKGYSLVEFDVTAAGTPAQPRTILSFPSGLFDQATEDGVGTMRFTAPTVNGKSRACRAHTQGVTWRLEGEEDFSPPTLLPDLTGDSA